MHKSLISCLTLIAMVLSPGLRAEETWDQNSNTQPTTEETISEPDTPAEDDTEMDEEEPVQGTQVGQASNEGRSG